MYFSFDNIGKDLSNYADVFNDFDYGTPTDEDDVYCNNCGYPLVSFLESGYVGCSKCYSEFKKYAYELAQSTHGRLDHVGKVPRGGTNKNIKMREIERLEVEKERAVKSEDYIKANEIKKQLERLRGNNNG